MTDMRLQVVSRSKQIAQCQINVDLPLLFGKVIFKRIIDEFVGYGKMTADYSWINDLLESKVFKKDTEEEYREIVFKEDIKDRYEKNIMQYFISVNAYTKLTEGKQIPDYQKDKIYKQLYDIRKCIIRNNVQKIIDMYKQNHAGIQAYTTMIKNYIRKAIEVGASVIIFPELSFAHLDLETDEEFMELTRRCIIVGGDMENVAGTELEEVLEDNRVLINNRIKLMLKDYKIVKNDEEVTLDNDDNLLVDGCILEPSSMYKEILPDIIRYIRWRDNYEDYKNLVKKGKKPLYYNVTVIYMDMLPPVKNIRKKCVLPREIKYNIISGKGYAVIKPGLFNFIMINCREAFDNILGDSAGIQKEIINIINYTNTSKTISVDVFNLLEMISQLKRMRDQDTPITAAAVISYQITRPKNAFRKNIETLFGETDIRLCLYTNTGTIYMLKNDKDFEYYGQTGLYYKPSSGDYEGYIKHLLNAYTNVINYELLQNNINLFYLKKNIRYGMLVSSYLDDPRHPYLTDLQVYLPEESEFGELVKLKPYKKIAQCQIVVDLPLLYGAGFFKRIWDVFNKGKENEEKYKITPAYTWLTEFTEKESINDFDEDIMHYFISEQAYKNLGSKEIPKDYKECPVFLQLYKIRECIIKLQELKNLNKKEEEYVCEWELIDLFRRNSAGISEYKKMIKRYVRKAKEAGADIIIFPELSFTNLEMEKDDEFVHLARDCTIIAGGIKEVPPSEDRGDILEYTKRIIEERKDKPLPDYLNEDEKLKIKDQYYDWIKNYTDYRNFVTSGKTNKALYYNVTLIFNNGTISEVAKNVNASREIKRNIVPGEFSDPVINSRLFNIILVNCEDFTIPDDEYEGHNNQVIEKILEQKNKPITAAAVISYKEDPNRYFREPFKNLFDKTEIGLALYTNSGTTGMKDIFGQTGLFCRNVSIEDIRKFDSINEADVSRENDKHIYRIEDNTEILHIVKLEMNETGAGSRIYFAPGCRCGMLVSSYPYTDDEIGPCLIDMEIYLPKDSENGELELV
ncbi:MAG: hypothetical protein JXJ04_26805 [Spirochaetales bacterium]|nr:hypothetical protein [Spirochaetales bacterium]